MSNKQQRQPVDPISYIGNALPYSDDGEKGILSALLQMPETLLTDAKESLPPESFYHPVNRTIYEQMLCFNLDDGLDLVTFSQHLIDKDLLSKVGGPAAIAELLSFIPTPEHYPHYKRILKEKLALRQVIMGGTSLISSAYANQGDMDEFRVAVEKELVGIAKAIQPEEQDDGLDMQLDKWQEDWELMAAGKKASAMPLRWESWNREAVGLQPGYNIISGSSSSGKSTLLGNMMVDACIRKDRPGLLFSNEMPVRMVVSRIIADLADVDGMHLFAPDKSHPQKHITTQIANALSEIRRSRLQIVHKPNMSADNMCNIARSVFTKHGDCVIGIDYLQIINRPPELEKGANREREVALNSSKFRVLSKELDCPVIALSQLNMDGTTRESAAVNMDCDSHIRIDRVKDHKTGKVTENGVWLAKNRNGRSDYHLPLFLEGSKFRFIER